MKRQNICRAVTYYINYIPSIKEKQECRFLTIGTVDGIDISDNLLKNCQNSNDDEKIMDKIRQEQKRFENELKGKFSAHQIFLIRNEECDIKNNEEEFWKHDGEMPFYFFCRCQIIKDSNTDWNYRKNIEEFLNSKAKISAMTYLTYDENDLFIVVKSAEYSIGVKTINELHSDISVVLESNKKIYLKNSYTVFAVGKKWVENLKDSDKQSLNSQKIKCVQISAMEKINGQIKEVAKKIGECLKDAKVQVLPILGEYDDIIIAENVGWGDFFSLFEKDGLFRNEIDTYNCNLAAVSTLVVTELDNIESVFLQDGKLITNDIEDTRYIKDYEQKIGVYNKRLEYLRQMSKEIKEFNVTDELNVILNTLSEFTGEVYNDYIFYSLLEPIEVMLRILQEAETKHHDDYIRRNKEYYYDFVNSLSMYIQAYNVSDKHRIQGLGINTKLYNVPIKISAFYNAFLYKITEILNISDDCKVEFKCNYVFLTVPSMQFNINVYEVFPNVSNRDRLIVMKMPEAGFFNISDMMNILAHETAHYVGRTFRKRRERLIPFMQTFVHVFLKYVLGKYKENPASYNIEFDTVVIEDIEKRLFDRIIRGLERRRAKVREEKLKEKIYHFSILLPFLKDVMDEIIENELCLIFTPLTEKCKVKDEASMFLIHIQEIAERFMSSHPDNSMIVDFESLTKNLFMYYEECFADVMSNLILGIKPKEYIECLMRESEVQSMNVKSLMESDVMFRVGTVILCMVDVLDEAYGWKEEFLKNDSADWMNIGDTAIVTCTGEDVFHEENIYDTIANKVVFEKLSGYLRGCMEDFLRKSKDNAKLMSDMKEVQDVYESFVQNADYNAEEQIKKITHIVDEYKDKLLLDKEETNDTLF